MKTGWVAIDREGTIRLAPLPEYFSNFLRGTYALAEKFPEILNNKNYQMSNILYDAEKSIKGAILICTEKFQTNQEHTTPLRNIYYSNFPKWQGETLTIWLHKQAPDRCKNQGADGEFFVIRNKIEYLRKAIVYDNIHIAMSLKVLYENGCTLCFDFFRSINNAKEKLATSELKVLWAKNAGNGEVTGAALPRDMMQLFVKHIQLEIPDRSPKMSAKEQIERKFKNFLISCGDKMKYFQSITDSDPRKDGTEKRHQEFCSYIKEVISQIKFFQENADNITLSNMRRAFQNIVLKNLGDSKIVRHSLEKPLGHTGDFQLLDMIVNNDLCSTGICYHFDRLQLENPSSIACKKRVEWVSDELLDIYAEQHGKKLRILDLGIGAAPIERRLVKLKNDILLDIVAVDMDFRALTFVQQTFNAEYTSLKTLNINLKNKSSLENIVHVASDRNCCIAIGILEALTEQETIELMRTLLTSMPKGALIYAEKYLPTHPARIIMEWFMDFFLGYSSSETMKNLVVKAGADPRKVKMMEDQSGTIVTLKITV